MSAGIPGLGLGGLFFILRIVNGFYMLSPIWRELVLRRPLLGYEKGH